MDSQHEREALEQADAHLAAGAARIRHQARLIEALDRDGHDVELALQLLRTLYATQQVIPGGRMTGSTSRRQGDWGGEAADAGRARRILPREGA